MARTDTERELQRFRHELTGSRRTRRAWIAGSVAAVAAVTAGVIVLVLALTGSSTKAVDTPVTQPTTSQAAVPALPADYPLGMWVAAPAGQQHASINFLDNGVVSLRDAFDNESWHVTFPAPQVMKFGASLNSELSCAPATYRYHVAHKTLAISPVGKDDCLNRTSIISHRGRTWKFTS